ncbi:MAG: alpha/beta fold hydrolase [Deltaproteobacteria bacterium]|nr:alpha/beta fold hydrolase [Deltaproteobacteria bacterium]
MSAAPAASPPRGVALIVHGLNFRPEGMLDVATLVSELSCDCLLVTLRGHGSNHAGATAGDEAARLSALRGIEHEIWVEEMRAAYRCARERALQCGAPLILVGFSLGGLLGIELIEEGVDGARYEGILLFAPPIRMRWYVGIVRCLAPFPRLVLPSFAPKQTAANAGTPVAAYTALFEASANVRAADPRQLDVPGLIFVDSRDELVSERGLGRWARARGLTRWRIVPIDRPLCRDISDYHHLIVDRERIGSDRWRTMREGIECWLQGVVSEFQSAHAQRGDSPD